MEEKKDPLTEKEREKFNNLLLKAGGWRKENLRQIKESKDEELEDHFIGKSVYGIIFLIVFGVFLGISKSYWKFFGVLIIPLFFFSWESYYISKYGKKTGKDSKNILFGLFITFLIFGYFLYQTQPSLTNELEAYLFYVIFSFGGYIIGETWANTCLKKISTEEKKPFKISFFKSDYNIKDIEWIIYENIEKWARLGTLTVSNYTYPQPDGSSYTITIGSFVKLFRIMFFFEDNELFYTVFRKNGIHLLPDPDSEDLQTSIDFVFEKIMDFNRMDEKEEDKEIQKLNDIFTIVLDRYKQRGVDPGQYIKRFKEVSGEGIKKIIIPAIQLALATAIAYWLLKTPK